MSCVNDFRLFLGKHDLVPIVIGAMGVDISTSHLATEGARLGGVAHISDAMILTVSDRHYGTDFVRQKAQGAKDQHADTPSGEFHQKFDLECLAQATRNHVSHTMANKRGNGLIFVNCMERLTMGAPRDTLRVRLRSALDAGIDGITLSAGLHLNSFSLIEDHPRFRDAKLGLIVSSRRALDVFLRKTSKHNRQLDYVIVEGPLAGGHLGFGLDWANYDLQTIVKDIQDFLRAEGLRIPLIPAGGIFSGQEAVAYLEMGCAAVQVATRFIPTVECGLPDVVKQEYIRAVPDDVVVNNLSSAGFPMRMLKQSPIIQSAGVPACDAHGYILDGSGYCSYLSAYCHDLAPNPARIPRATADKMCLCQAMWRFNCWTCGQNVHRLKETTEILDDGTYKLLRTEDVFRSYQYG